MMKIFSIGFVLALALVIPIDAQQDEIELSRSVIETQRQAIIAKNMELTEAEGAAFWPAFRAFRGELAGVGDRTVALIKSYAEAFNSDSMTDAKAEALMKEWFAIKEAELKTKKRWWKKFSNILPAAKAARYYQLENKLDALITVELADQIPLIP